MSEIKRILVPLDLNRLGEAKIPMAEAQARAFGAEIVLLHVLSNEPVPDEGVTLAEAQAHTYLDVTAARLTTEGIAARALVRHGPVAEAILDEINLQQIDLVVLGTNVRHGISRVLLGSVAEAVAARAGCPVLLIRPEVRERERRYPLRSFQEDAERAGPVAPRSLGIRTVEVARIVGSVGRAQDLGTNFRPIEPTREDQTRYRRILALMEQGNPLPPVALYKLGYGYYVLDGNHRVAASKEIGQLEVEAEVTEFVPLGDPEAQRIFAERRLFESTTGLNRIGVARPGQYPRLEDMIRAFGAERGIGDLREAAQRWSIDVYQPVARRIRALRLREHLPGLRTADIFLEVAGFRERETERLGHAVDWGDALARFHADRFHSDARSPGAADR